MALELDFIINDESVNRYGYRIISAGINTENFLKNPICLYQHSSENLSIGRWKNLRVEGNVFKATLEFDETDDFAKKLYNKYKNKYMSAVSLSMLRITETDDPKYLLPGQRCETVLECELLEMSLVTVPGNANSIKLFNKDGEECKLNFIVENKNSNQIQTKMAITKTVEELQADNDKLKKQLAADLIKKHQERGAINADNALFFENSAMLDYDGTKLALEKLPSKKDDTGDTKKLAAQLIEMHQKRGAITAQELAFYTKAAESDYEGTKKILEAKKGTEVLDNIVSNLSTDKTKQSDSKDRSKWNFSEWYKNDLDGLQKMETEKPEDYKKLQLAYREDLKKEGTYIPSED
ncbi:MAG: HK97 family phage prohead protease [Bacteroidetes bacterium]|nr:HK97 family phage prohead protease [Bacteroidota bacterium]